MSISFEIWTIWSLWEMIFNAIEVWLVYRFFMHTLTREENHKLRPAIGGICLFAYITIMNNVSGIDGKFMTILSYCGTLVYALSMFKESMAQKLFVGILPIIVVIYSDLLTFALSITLDIFSPDRAWEPTYERFLMNIIYIIFTVLFYILANIFYQSFQQIARQSMVLTVCIAVLEILSILVVNFLIAIGTELTALDADTKRLKIYIIFIGIVFLIIYSSCIFFFKAWNVAFVKNQENKMQNQYRVLKEEYYDNIQKSLEKLEYFRHDIMKHFQILSILMDSDKKEKAQEYLATIHSQYSQQLEVSNYTNDDVLNAVLSNKKSVAEKNGISIRISAEKIKKFPLSSYELCSLFDNLLDNAIEACQKVDTERFVDLFISLADGQICIIVKNSYSGDLLIKDKTFITTKKDKLNHGMGLRIINNIVSGVDGTCKTEFDKTRAIFTVTVSIPMSN